MEMHIIALTAVVEWKARDDMTREEIENLPKNVNTLLDLSVTMPTRQKLNEKLNKVCELAIKALQQEPKQGHWIYTLEDWNKWECSECGFTKRTDVHVYLGYKYCPKCGLKMEVSK